MAHEPRHHRQVLAQELGGRDFGVRRTSADRDLVIPNFYLPRNDPRNVHEAGRRMPAVLHIPQKRLTACKEHGAFGDGKFTSLVE
jgi:hypothetical protein